MPQEIYRSIYPGIKNRYRRLLLPKTPIKKWNVNPTQEPIQNNTKYNETFAFSKPPSCLKTHHHPQLYRASQKGEKRKERRKIIPIVKIKSST